MLTSRTAGMSFLLAAAVAAQQNERPTPRPEVSAPAQHEAHAFRRATVPGDAVAVGVARLQQLRWYTNLGAALKAGRELDRPVLWIQALGDLDGFL